MCFQGQLGSTQSRGLIPCVLLVLKEMLPTYHKWRYNTYGVRERIGEHYCLKFSVSLKCTGVCLTLSTHCSLSGCLILELVHAILNLSQEGESEGR